MSSRTAIHLAGVVALTFGLEAYLDREIRSLSAECGRMKQLIVAAVAGTREAAVQANEDQYDAAAALEADLAAAPGQVTAEARAANLEAQRRAALLARRMAQSRKTQLARVDAELASIRASAQATGEAASQLATELRSQRPAALTDGADLSPVERQLGVLNEAIEANAARLATLKASARRESFPFRAGKPRTEAGGLAILIRRADPKHQRFTLEITAADGKTQIRDGTLNEPIRVGGSYELVVNEIAKNEVGALLARDYSSGSAETRNLPGR